MKIQRKWLLIITASLGVIIILYSLIRHFTGYGLGEKEEKFFMDGIIFSALGLFLYNRKLASDEKKAREAAERAAGEAEQRAAEGEAPESEEAEALPHWERQKNSPPEE